MQDSIDDQENLLPLDPSMNTLAQDFSHQLNFCDGKVEEEENIDCEGDETDEDDEDFSFFCDGVDISSLEPEETRLVFPLFNTGLLDGERLPVRPPVEHLYAETSNEPVPSSSSGNDAVSGPYCEWSSKNNPPAGPDGCCKKSNSTGFSKLWRLKEFGHRSHSDGRDAFVFLNHPPLPPPSSEPKIKAAEKRIVAGAVKVNGEVGGKKLTTSAPQKKKKKSEAVLAHERYMKSKAKDEERRRSYLPYRPELVGFFTNVNGGGLTRNVHPY